MRVPQEEVAVKLCGEGSRVPKIEIRLFYSVGNFQKNMIYFAQYRLLFENTPINVMSDCLIPVWFAIQASSCIGIKDDVCNHPQTELASFFTTDFALRAYHSHLPFEKSRTLPILIFVCRLGLFADALSNNY